MNNTKVNLDINMEAKTRIKVNIYKTLLEEEKNKNKRNTTIGLSLFIVGIVSTTTLYQIKEEIQPQTFKVDKKIVERSPKKALPKYLTSNVKLDILNTDVLKNKRVNNVSEEDFFVSDFKM